MLWRAGDGQMNIFDVQKNKVDEVIHSFWNHQNEKTKPIGAISSADAYRILGISRDSLENSILHYYERNDQKVEIITEIARKALEPLGTIS